MKLIIDGKDPVEVHKLTLDQWRKFMAEFLGQNVNASAAWDIMGCVRGPDAGLGETSERPNQTSKDHEKSYSARRARKFDTVEILRQAMFYGVMGGAARSHKDDKVTLPPQTQWDHFDKHVARAANRIGIKVVEREK